jgi:hypothetical protein
LEFKTRTRITFKTLKRFKAEKPKRFHSMPISKRLISKNYDSFSCKWRGYRSYNALNEENN